MVEMLMKGVSRQVKLPGKGTQESEKEAVGVTEVHFH